MAKFYQAISIFYDCFITCAGRDDDGEKVGPGEAVQDQPVPRDKSLLELILFL